MQDLLGPPVRGLILASLMVLAGTATTFHLVGKIDLAREPGGPVIRGWLSRLPGLVAWFLLTLMLVRGALQVLAFTFPGEPVDPELARAVLLGGSWGVGWMIMTAGSFILVALMWLLRERASVQGAVLAVFCAAFILAQAGMGHGADELWQPLIVGRLFHASHLLGAGIWLGTLAVLALAVFPSLESSDSTATLAALVRRYSLFARIGAGMIVITSALMIWTYAGSIAALASSRWGIWLMLKLAAFTGVMALGWWNWRVVTPRLERGATGASRSLRQAATLELVLGSMVVAGTAMLVVQGLPIDGG